MIKCNHKIPSDHIVSKKGELPILWKCSSCGDESIWSTTHSRWGCVECLECGFASADWIACCDKCAKTLKLKAKTIAKK
jgi:predicted RNA-binding Zn-ribbon protein involved in translation (DUF1610 family)